MRTNAASVCVCVCYGARDWAWMVGGRHASPSSFFRVSPLSEGWSSAGGGKRRKSRPLSFFPFSLAMNGQGAPPYPHTVR